jgi:hypothetical protein
VITALMTGTQTDDRKSSTAAATRYLAENNVLGVPPRSS